MGRHHVMLLAPAVAATTVLVLTGPTARAQENGDGPTTDVDDLDAFILDIEATVLDIEYGTEVTESPEEVTITLEADVFFDFDEHELRPDAVEALTGVVEQIRDDGATELLIHGHTDAEGGEDYNRNLSEQRAGAVETFLADRVDGLTMTTEGFGESEPVASNDSEEGRARNRRVVITYPR